MGGGIPFGHYLLNRRIARGGMAEVFLATQHGPEGFERQVAIKRILPHLADSREFVEMFMDEARLAARLTHPNIAHIYEFGQVDDAYFIAMEYIDGVDLAPIFLAGERDLMPLAHVTRIAADVAAGLHYAHQQRSPDGRPLGIVHRDISPQNILVSFDGAVKIVDFGIAKATHHMDRTNPGEIRGKFSYMSPEQTRGEHLDGRSDVFCLGIVLYELVTGHALFSRTDPIGAMEEIRGGVLPTPTRQGIPLPSQLLQILQHALERDPDARYADAAAMQLDLETFLHSLQEISNSLTLAKYFREHYGAPRAEPSSGSPAPERAPGTMRAPEKPETVAAPDSDITARSPGNVTMLDTPAPREPPPGKPASPEPKTQILLRHNSNALDTSDESNTQIESSHRQVHGYLPASNGLPRADPNDATTLLRSPPPKHARDVPSSIPSRDQAPNAEAITGGPEKNTPTERIATARRRVAALIALITLILSASVLGYFLATPTFDAHPSSTGSGATHSTAATAPTTLQSLPGHITNAPADGAIDERTHAPDGETSDRDGDTPG
ncbi:MAG: protein kinase, partial [Deltaproteobacteria bacterium]|nr:protein kinase [Deltaproteobacteria bacterium]